MDNLQRNSEESQSDVGRSVFISTLFGSNVQRITRIYDGRSSFESGDGTNGDPTVQTGTGERVAVSGLEK